MKRLRILGQLIRADFLERTRRYSFLITLGVMVYVGYLAVPAADAGVLTVNLGNLRGIYNSAWIGSMIALLSSMLLSLPGFYLVKNAIARDRETGVGQIIATTPLRKVSYALGKMASNFIFLAVIVGLVMIAAGAMQLLRGEVMRLAPWDLVAPFLFVTLPTLALVAAVALFFEAVPFLRGGFGNLVYFALYIVTLIVSLSGATFSGQGVIEEPINDLFGATVIGASMLQAAHQAYPNRPLDFGIGYAKVEGPIETFRWTGVTWSADALLGRLVWLGVALGITLVTALLFDRFDPARSARRRAKDPGVLQKLHQRISAFSLPRLRLLNLSALPLPTFGRVLLAEIRLALRGLRWWWYLVALGLIVAGASAGDAEARRGMLLAAWVWPTLVWSKLGVRERRHHTAPVVFSTPHPLRRQLPATWLTGVLIALLMGGGVGLNLALAGQVDQLLAWGVAALFVPTLALAAGVWSGSSKLFEALYVTAWYIGPVSGLAELDFMGVTPEALAQGMPHIYLIVTLILLALVVLGRARQIRH